MAGPTGEAVALERRGGGEGGRTGMGGCHTRFLRPKPDAHRMYAQDQVVIHTVRM
jgi:Glu-tRNA(Gln) amidotransferase subunit E-like FAD-binding protein